MNTFISKDLLKTEAAKFGVELDEIALDRFDKYAKLLVEWNEKINLTAITDPEGIVMKHFVDSLSVFSAIEIPEGAKSIDVGTGAGFPGLAMLIARPDLKITLLDSTNKKLTVIRDILEKLELTCEVLHMRAEEAGQSKDYREKYDFATARAVSNLRDLSEYCLPFVKKGGKFIAMKGPGAEEELTEAKRAIGILGGKNEKLILEKLPEDNTRNFIVVEKLLSTPEKYPRASAKISKNPL